MNAVICGAGIAGLALAGRLAELGWSVTLVDAAPASRDESYMIDLFGSGFEAADRMGLMPRLRERAYEFAAVRWTSGSGRTSAHLPYRVIASLLDGRLLSLIRGDLERAVLEQLPNTVELRFNTAVTQIRTPVGRVEARLSSGEVLSADVLVGADGIHSRIRELTFGDGSAWLRFLGFHTAAFAIDAPDLAAELNNQLTIVSDPGRQLALYPLREGKVAASFVRRAANSAPPISAVEALEAAYGDLGGQVTRVLAHARGLSSFIYEQVGQVVMAHWCRGRIALLGDACQAASFLPGQGASLSLAAAYVLGEELSSGPDVKAALVRYEHRVRPPLVHMRRVGRKAADWLVPATPTGLVARNAVIRLASRPGFSWLLRPMAEAAREEILTPASPTS